MKARDILLWLAGGVAGALLLVWAHPRVFGYAPRDWQVNRQEATEIALERLRDLGAPVPDGFIVAWLDDEAAIERRLQLAGVAPEALGETLHQVSFWSVRVYPPKARPTEWAYRAEVGFDGRVMALRWRQDPEAGGGRIDPAAARARADEFLAAQGLPLAQFAEPAIRAQDLARRTDTTLRYLYREQPLAAAGVETGMQVVFAGERLAGFEYFFDDPRRAEIEAEMQGTVFLGNLRFGFLILILPLVALPFLRRYHAGEVGVKRGLQIAGVIVAAGILFMPLTAKAATEGMQWGPLSRAQLPWMWGPQFVVIYFIPVALIAFLSWSTGESLCRERWGHKLAAFDAVARRRVGNATVARAALRGSAAGLMLAGGALLLAAALARAGVSALIGFNLGPWWPSASWAALAGLLFMGIHVIYGELFGRLFLVSGASRRRRSAVWIGLATLLAAVLLWDAPVSVMNVGWTLVFSILGAATLVFLFLRYDLLTTMVASLACSAAVASVLFVGAQDPWLQFQGCLLLLGGFLPLVLTARHLASGEEFVYRYEDIPPHVRRIAERERQRVELETARSIQSSILPQLPPRLQGVDLAHAYLPASEVGGDFYDVLALEDGRLALAVGDVAGHGVSSGLVMSMAKSALAVQVTFDPEVAAVFETLNRMVYQTARKRMLATLCYALLDPLRRELRYASAGHLFPYRVSQDGRVEGLESISYPLGVRPELPVQDRLARLEAGDYLVLYSDGVIEAHRDGSD
ncbi:MAG TPA: PP2C family protein-serine/threonine phosphatase, partial [Thermoanaerobaculia bacterium]|nr:PP2C family protein-serine/threonine phosphatase [Thermoanaerobaculia bacterium]